MLTENYIEALLVDEELADQVWEEWDAGPLTDDLAQCAWWCIFQAPNPSIGAPRSDLPNS